MILDQNHPRYLEDREAFIIKLIIDETPKKEIIKCIEETYSLSNRRAYDLYNECMVRLRKLKTFSPRELLSIHCERYDSLYRIAMALGIPMAALRALKQRNKLTGASHVSIGFLNNKVVIKQDIQDTGWDLSLLNDQDRDKLRGLLLSGDVG